MSDAQVPTPVRPAQAVHAERVTLKTVLGDSAGLAISAGALLAVLALIVLSVVNYTSRHRSAPSGWSVRLSTARSTYC